jgi:alpha-beta hydrolase superfamily lysophospholipase
MKPLFFPDDPQFWYETQRALGHSAYGGAELGEVAVVAERITPGDYDSWYNEWTAAADARVQEATTALNSGHIISARDAFLRASNYARSAEFFLHGNPLDPRIDKSYAQSVDAFGMFVKLSEGRIEKVEIPFEDSKLYGYFYRSGSKAKSPTVIMHNGFDGSAEEMHFFGAAAAVERGYNVLSFDGPGQPSARRRHGMLFRPNWESVVTPVLDWLLAERTDVATNQIALLGISMGGLLAPRAAAFEPRLAAVMAVDGVYDLGEISTQDLPMPRDQAEILLRADEEPEIDAALAAVIEQNPTARWAFTHGMYAMGVDSPRKFLAAYLDYTLAGGIAEKIAVPTLVAEAQDDLFFAGQAQKLYDHIVAPKELLLFTTAEGAGAHCHSGAQRLAFGRIYDWLDNALAIQNQLSRVRSLIKGF